MKINLPWTCGLGARWDLIIKQGKDCRLQKDGGASWSREAEGLRQVETIFINIKMLLVFFTVATCTDSATATVAKAAGARDSQGRGTKRY